MKGSTDMAKKKQTPTLPKVDQAIEFSYDDLTFEEAEVFETLAGLPLDRVDEVAQSKVLRIMTFIVLSRTNPKITYAEVGKMRVTEVVQSGDPKGPIPPG